MVNSRSKRDRDSINGEDSYGGRRTHSKHRKYESPCQIVTSKRRGGTANVLDIAVSNTATQAPPNTISDTDEFVPLPKHLHRENKKRTAERRGHRLVDIEALESVVNSKFCCKQCNARAVQKEIKEFLSYADDFYAKKKKEFDKIEDLACKVREYKKMKKPGALYVLFVGMKAKKEKKYEVGVPVVVKDIFTTGWATQIDFQCCARQYFGNKDRRKHVYSIVPSIFKGNDPKKHASYILNQQLCVVSIGLVVGPSIWSRLLHGWTTHGNL